MCILRFTNFVTVPWPYRECSLKSVTLASLGVLKRAKSLTVRLCCVLKRPKNRKECNRTVKKIKERLKTFNSIEHLGTQGIRHMSPSVCFKYNLRDHISFFKLVLIPSNCQIISQLNDSKTSLLQHSYRKVSLSSTWGFENSPLCPFAYQPSVFLLISQFF